ncbi:hypothetical protein QFC20_007201 [Naganishia adeliensis]|uniref:Uncharacterized protein n=1 Tax=Naganishia adeliensis TaxID=92952 RepID=A0ACC2V231_9TREE|nr:hypothetical protein QFC20_007201 [Naganishia adeliensis]
MFATSSSSPDPLETLANLALTAEQSPILSDNPSVDNITKIVQQFYLLVHDVATEGSDLARAQQVLQQITQRYGPHCSLLVINSKMRNTSPPPSGSSGQRHATEMNAPYHDKYLTALAGLTCVDPFTRLTEVLAEDVHVRKVDGHLVALRGDARLPQYTYAQYLDEKDIQSIRECIRGVIVQSVIPWMEARVREWNEMYAGSRTGITGRILGAGRKFLGSVRSHAIAPLNSGSEAKGHHSDRSFMHLAKRLADFAFMLKDNALAKTVYQLILQDYSPESRDRDALRHAKVMYAVACLQNLSTADHSLEQAFQIRQHSIKCLRETSAFYSSSMFSQLLLLKDVIIFLEFWKCPSVRTGRQPTITLTTFLVEISRQFEEILSAIVVEEAAYLDISAPSAHTRRHVFHSMTAANRYERSGLKSFSRNCFVQALAVIRPRKLRWKYAGDFVNYDLGRQAYTSGDSRLALRHFASLLRAGTGVCFQAGILEDYILAYQGYLKIGQENAETEHRTRLLSVPVFDVTQISTQSVLSHVKHAGDRDLAPNAEDVAAPDNDLHCHREVVESNNGAASQETFGFPVVDLVVCNPLNIPLHLTELQLNTHKAPDHANREQALYLVNMPNMVLLPSAEQSFRITAGSSDRRLDSVSYKLNRKIPGGQDLSSPLSSPLHVNTRDMTDMGLRHAAPRGIKKTQPCFVKLEFIDLPRIILVNELVTGKLRLSNFGVSPVQIKFVQCSCSQDGVLFLEDAQSLARFIGPL